MALIAGTRLGRYEILAPIGAGGMGEVYRARDLKLEREVAIKFLPDAVAHNPERLARFDREAKVLASLNHPNIAQIYGIEDRALVMELVQGDTLKGPVPLETALKYAAQIASALEAAHDKGIVHRDLKPANIMVTRDGIVKLLDFGLAAHNRDASSASPEDSPTITMSATQAGVIIGTAAYMSPEQASGQAVDRRCDIWSFGVVLLEMLTGERAFTGDTVSHVLAGVLTKDLDLSRVPARVRRLLKSCLRKDPKQRLQAIGDWKLLLDDMQPAEAETKKSSPLPWAVAAAGIIAAVAVSVIHFREVPPPAPLPVRFTVPLPPKASFTVVGGFALSPDGRMLAFAADGADGVNRLYVRSLDSLEARPLPGTEGIDSSIYDSVTLAWSPDSRSLVFQAAANLKRVELTGAPAQTLCECRGFGAAWNRDGVILIGTARGIERIPSGGGTPTTVTSVNASGGELGHSEPSFLPDGRRFLYHRRSQDPAKDGVYEGDLNVPAEGQSSQRLIAAAPNAVYAPSADPAQGRILFLRDGTLMAQIWDVKHSSLSGDPVPVAEQVSVFQNVWGRFSASANGTLVYRTGDSLNLQPTWLDRDGKPLGTVGEPDRYYVLVLNRDGTKAGVGRVDASGKRDLWVLDLAHGTRTRLTTDPGDPENVVFSPDGARAVFVSVRGADVGFYEKPSSGAGAEQTLLSSGAGTALTEWTRDGRFLLFAKGARQTQFDLWVLPMEGEHKPFPFLRTQFHEIGARLSPDGRWIAYYSNESGKTEIYVKRFIAEPDGGASAAAGKWLISHAGGVGMIHWRNDGKELYYLAPDGKIMVVEVGATGSDFRSGVPKALFSIPQAFVRRSTTPGSLADITPDGKRFLFALPVEQNQSNDFKVVLNWEAGLKR